MPDRTRGIAFVPIAPGRRGKPRRLKCHSCGEEKSDDQVHAGICHVCRDELASINTRPGAVHVPIADRVRQILLRYGITYVEFAEMYRRQNGQCAICGAVPDVRKGLCVDHDHGTGAVRGLLCDRCNRGIGHFNDDPELLRSALGYLEAATTL